MNTLSIYLSLSIYLCFVIPYFDDYLSILLLRRACWSHVARCSPLFEKSALESHGLERADEIPSVYLPISIYLSFVISMI